MDVSKLQMTHFGTFKCTCAIKIFQVPNCKHFLSNIYIVYINKCVTVLVLFGALSLVLQPGSVLIQMSVDSKNIFAEQNKQKFSVYFLFLLCEKSVASSGRLWKAVAFVSN